ncbi:glycosyltransferase [Edwardsiella anguillarum]|nr:glycosyltransferase [Edwardsiella anguillarum]
MDIYISTSAHETCSLSCIEAMSFGIPIISANIDGQPEIISNGHTGFCIAPTMSMEDYCKKQECRCHSKKISTIQKTIPLAPTLIKPQRCSR